MDDIDETAARLGELLAKATKGVWEIDTIKNEGSYGNGPDCVEGFESYKIIAGSGNSLLDSLNSETAEVHEDGPGELGEYHAWDDVALHNFELIAAMKNALPALLSERKAMKAEIERLQSAQQWREIESAPRDGTPIEVRVNWLWNGGRGDEVELIDIAHFDSSVSNWVFVTAPNYFQQLDRRCTITLWRPLQAHTVTGDKQ